MLEAPCPADLSREYPWGDKGVTRAERNFRMAATNYHDKRAWVLIVGELELKRIRRALFVSILYWIIVR